MSKQETKKPTTKKPVKFKADSVEGKSIKEIKARQKKIDNAGVTLVALWYAQGLELKTLQLLLECSARELEKHTGLKRTAIATYMNIAEDPRLGEPETVKKLGVFTQKQLLNIAKLDEDEFNEAVETGILPKSETSPTESRDDEAVDAEVIETVEWKQELFDIISGAVSEVDAEAQLRVYFDIEDEPEDEPEDEGESDRHILIRALGATGETTLEGQAEELGVKVKALDKALNKGDFTKGILKKCNEYLAD